MSGLKNANFVDTVLQDLLHRDLIFKCNKHFLWLITVFIQSNKQKRLILDLRAVNEHLWKKSELE